MYLYSVAGPCSLQLIYRERFYSICLSDSGPLHDTRITPPHSAREGRGGEGRGGEGGEGRGGEGRGGEGRGGEGRGGEGRGGEGRGGEGRGGEGRGRRGELKLHGI